MRRIQLDDEPVREQLVVSPSALRRRTQLDEASKPEPPSSSRKRPRVVLDDQPTPEPLLSHRPRSSRFNAASSSTRVKSTPATTLPASKRQRVYTLSETPELQPPRSSSSKAKASAPKGKGKATPSRSNEKSNDKGNGRAPVKKEPDVITVDDSEDEWAMFRGF
jgi:hypothetical protein